MSNRLSISLVVSSLLLPAFSSGAELPAAEGRVKSGESRWVFSLLPKSLQQNPRLDITVITEVTEEGKKLPEPSPSMPTYFDAVSTGYRAIGDETVVGAGVSDEQIHTVLFKSLAKNGYLKSDTRHRPTQLIIYTWGTHALPTEADPENPTISADLITRNMLDRAALVGGTKFAEEMRKLFSDANAMALADAKPVQYASSEMPEVQSVLHPDSPEFTNPIHRYKLANPKNAFLVEQAASDVYYIVASSYDYEAVKANKRVLLWRTRMTVASTGVSHAQTIPTLITAAGPYFGKETKEPEILSKRSVREGSVEIGESRVLETVERIPGRSKQAR